jgi:hypothetical protein
MSRKQKLKLSYSTKGYCESLMNSGNFKENYLCFWPIVKFDLVFTIHLSHRIEKNKIIASKVSFKGIKSIGSKLRRRPMDDFVNLEHFSFNYKCTCIWVVVNIKKPLFWPYHHYGGHVEDLKTNENSQLHNENILRHGQDVKPCFKYWSQW